METCLRTRTLTSTFTAFPLIQKFTFGFFARGRHINKSEILKILCHLILFYLLSKLFVNLSNSIEFSLFFFSFSPILSFELISLNFLLIFLSTIYLTAEYSGLFVDSLLPNYSSIRPCPKIT